MGKRVLSVMIKITASIFLSVSCLIAQQGHVFVKAAPSGPQISTTLSGWTDIPDMSMIIDQMHPGNVSIGFSAEAFTGGTQRMFVRALVDDQPSNPPDVVFTLNSFTGTNSFRFSTNIASGQHEVKIQWLVDAGGTAYMGDRTIFVVTAPGIVNTIAAPSGPDVTTTSSSFTDIPDLIYTVNFPETGHAVITIAGEVETSDNARMFVRALVNDQVSSPSDVVFTLGPYSSTKEFTFVKTDLPAGNQLMHLQWLVDAGYTAYLGDRTFTIGFSGPDAFTAGMGGIKSVSAPSGPFVTTTSIDWSDIPDLNVPVSVPENAMLVVSLTAEAYSSAGKRMFVRALIGDEVMEPSDVVFATEIWNGTHGFHFVKENVPPGNPVIHLQWLVDGGGTASLGDRNMTVIGFPAVSTAVKEKIHSLQPETTILEQNYPNPFNMSTKFRYTLSKTGHVIVRVYDLKGGLVRELVNSTMSQGSHEAVFNASGLPSGIYLIRVETGNTVGTRKIVLQK